MIKVDMKKDEGKVNDDETNANDFGHGGECKIGSETTATTDQSKNQTL